MSESESTGLYAAKTALEGRADVVAIDITTDIATDAKTVEIVLAPEHDTVPPRISRVVATCDVALWDVSHQGTPSHVVLTGVEHGN